MLSLLFLSACTTKIATNIENARETIIPLPSKILESGLPSKHQIKTAFIPQSPEKNWDQPWQDSCEEASILTLKHYYSADNPSTETLLAEYQQIFSYEAQNNWTHDINLQKMAQLSTDLFQLKPAIIDSPSTDDLKKYISKNIPVIVTANGKTLYQENKHFKSGGPLYHSLVILGFDDDIGKFIVHDVGTQFGAYFQYSYSLLMESIHDLPSNGDKNNIEQGDKKILILVK